jgi:hypothetical protein
MSTWLAITLPVLLAVFVGVWVYENVVMEWDVELGRIDGEWGTLGWYDFHDTNVALGNAKVEQMERDKELTRLYHQAFTIGSAKKAVEFLRKAGVIR